MIFKDVERVLKQHAGAIDHVGKAVQEMHYDKQLQAYREAVQEGFKHAQGYTNVVLGVGYAGFFALWSLMRAEIPPVNQAWAALLMGFSLAVFIAWEIYQMTSNAFAASELHALLEVGDRRPSIEAINAAVKRHGARHALWWPVALAFTVVPAIGGGAVLFYALAARLVALL